MWTRIELKSRGKQMLHKCFWAAVVVCLISSILSGEFGTANSGTSYRKVLTNQRESSLDSARHLLENGTDVQGVLHGVTAAITSVAVTVFFVIILIVIVVLAVIGGPIEVGSKYFFMSNRVRRAEISMVFQGFRGGYLGNIIWTMLLRAIKTMLWGLLLIVPGIIKSYEYRMIPYILSENPGISTRRAFELSREMMYGQKWDCFVLDLSFILWQLLGCVTCGLSNIFYVNPYVAATNAELYAVLREDALRRGVAGYGELPGFY